LKVYLEGLNRCNANLMGNNAKFKMNDVNRQLKIRSEAGFPMKGTRTSPLYYSRLEVEVFNCLLIEMSETNK